MDPEFGSTLKHAPTKDKDAYDLADMGHSQAMSRKFDTWSMLSLAFVVLGTWSVFAQSLASGLMNGGPVAILWGLCLVAACNICIGLSLGELCSSMPTALGQAYWVSQLWPTAAGRFFSYLCAWINTFGWWTLSASTIAFMTEFILGMNLLFDPSWPPASKGWVQFLVYLSITALLTALNVVACRKDKVLPMFNNFIGITFVALFFIFGLALLISVGVRNGLEFQSTSFVFGAWINQTGWTDGITWFMGLVQAAYGLTAFDAAIHLVEEIPAPRKNVPKVIWLSILCGAATGFIFMMICLFCIQDLDQILDPSTGLPFMDLVKSTVGLEGSAVLLALFIVNGLGQGVTVVTTASRLTWGFARDGGLPFGVYFAHVDEYWKAPVRALWMQGAVIGLVGVLYTFSNTVLEAIVGVSTIALTVSYAMPILTLLIVGRDKLQRGPFSLGRLGPVVNGVSLVYCAVTTVFFFFPSEPKPAPADMNYAIVVFGIIVVFSLSFWFIRGRQTYLQADEISGQVIYGAPAEVAQEGVNVNLKGK
ncbi:Choline transport protein [Colletotrichum siamense]|uniref:Choline transport protein n=1 Tax=Colletotrichum siamense TaxID=690259 RepID=A0A9P5EWW2_COLSI|nr:Choline transport protein [Colletotrichum siamense]KAF4861050.1 Choline transport protein [Colletotrichum siamense]